MFKQVTIGFSVCSSTLWLELHLTLSQDTLYCTTFETIIINT